MAKSVHPDVLDASHDVTALADQMLICSAEPSDRANALTLALADVAMTPGDGNDYTVGAGAPDGRSVTMAAKNGVLIDANGDGTHVALIDGTRLLRVTTMASQTLTAGNQANIAAWTARIAAPT